MKKRELQQMLDCYQAVMSETQQAAVGLLKVCRQDLQKTERDCVKLEQENQTLRQLVEQLKDR